jgi:hypothetical protein
MIPVVPFEPLGFQLVSYGFVKHRDQLTADHADLFTDFRLTRFECSQGLQ